MDRMVQAAVISAGLPKAMPALVEIPEKSSIACCVNLSAGLWIAGLTRLELGQLSASDLFSTC